MIERIRSRNTSSRATWQNVSALSSIKQMQLNDNDSHPSVSSKPLIKDEELNPTAKPNLPYKYTCSSTM